jgi:hypothetical protein
MEHSQNRQYPRLQNKSEQNKKIEITTCILFDKNAILNNKSSSRKYTNNWRLNSTLLNNHEP